MKLTNIQMVMTIVGATYKRSDYLGFFGKGEEIHKTFLPLFAYTGFSIALKGAPILLEKVPACLQL